MLQILLFAGISSILEVGYVSTFHIINVKKPTTGGLSAVVKNYSNMPNFDAIQRLNAGDQVFAYLVGLIEWKVGFQLQKMVSTLNMNATSTIKINPVY